MSTEAVLGLIIVILFVAMWHAKYTDHTEQIISANSANQLAAGVKTSITQRRDDNALFAEAAKKRNSDSRFDQTFTQGLL